MACLSCGFENPQGAKFCNECGASLAVSNPERGTERKVVSVLFCDLVGFTASSALADPEDVLATVRPYHSLLRTQIEGFGGTVEKFIGDAVMAVFGAPVAHEDDAERAIRAGLKILETLDEMNEREGLELSVRIGINTGEAMVSIGARPEAGEGIVTGDVVNTAARIQAGAPVGGVAVGEITYLSTKDVFDFAPLAPIEAKGKAEPVVAWQAVAARARFGTDVTRTHATQLIGRDVERSLLRGLFDRAVRDRTCHLVTILGEPGVGKSRMVTELFSYIDDERAELITWRQGRCLPYGDGITFWALGEIVKAHAGILESDSVEEVGDKLDLALRARGSFEAAEVEWLKARLAPLVGAETAGAAEQEESFTAWRRFLEAAPGSDPVVYVFEDLHWADPLMLAFIEHLVDWSEGAPMLVLATARPELSERHPNWGAGLRNATTMNLGPLSEDDTARLIGELLGQTVLPADVQAPIVERAGGNPLYAEEFIRMLKDRGLLTMHGRTWELVTDATIPFPEGVHGLIAARLDTLTSERKALVQDAAVIGKVFWAGAVAAMGGREVGAVRDELHELTRKEFVRASRRSSMEGEQEYGFWHLLVRDVAYAQIPRAARASKHIAAAQWIADRAGERAEDLADVLAHHYAEALALVDASSDEASMLGDRAVRFFLLAGNRAAELDPVRAAKNYERALELAPDGHPSRPDIQVALAKVAFLTNQIAISLDLLEEAIPALVALGETARAADAQVTLYNVKRSVEPTEATLSILDDAIASLEGLPPGPELVDAYASRAHWGYVADIHHEAYFWADKALGLSERLGLPPSTKALRVRGGIRSFTGDLDGIEELRRSIDLATESGLMREAVQGRNELTNVLAAAHGTEAAARELETALMLARRCGLREMEVFMESSGKLEVYYDLGRWDELASSSAALLAQDRDDVDRQSRLFCRIFSISVAIWRGDLKRATEIADGLFDELLASGEAQLVVAGLDVMAHLGVALADAERAAACLRQLEMFPNARDAWNYPSYVPEIVRLACHVLDVDFAERLTVGIPSSTMERSRVALAMVKAELAEARGEKAEAIDLYEAAERGWRAFSVPERGQALLGRGRCLVEVGDPAATVVLREARDVFASLAATRFVADADALLERSVRRSS